MPSLSRIQRGTFRHLTWVYRGAKNLNLSMPPVTKTLSPAELAKLEHAFATDPGSEAYKPLAEAYLGMGRFMEAMVVCKKGVKAHPNTPDPRLLLARVYAEQGKDKKALEELAGALQVAPSDKNVLRMTGALQLKGGEAGAGKVNLLKAWELDPADKDTEAALKQYKIELPKPPEPEALEVPISEDLPTEQMDISPGPPAVIPPEPKSGVRRPPAGPPQVGREPTTGVRQPPNGAPGRAPQVPAQARPPARPQPPPQGQRAPGARPAARPAPPAQVTYRA